MLVAPISVLAFDVDGVLTDGAAVIDVAGERAKRLRYRDLDAFSQAKQRGFKIGLVSGESGPLLERIAERVGADVVVDAAKDKRAGLARLADLLNIELAQVCYVGDADRDAAAFDLVGLSCAPADASPLARARADKVLATPGGAGVAEEVVALVLAVEDEALLAPRRQHELRRIVEHSISVHQRLLERSLPALSRISGMLLRVLRSGGKVLLCGNGGSAADAQHVAAELVGRFAIDREPWPAIALTTDSSVLTAVANDWDYRDVFARQVAALGRTGDLVVGISTSGRSPNVLRALEVARRVGAATVAFTGEQPGPLEPRADICFAAPSRETPRIQELHLLAWHGICEIVECALSPRETLKETGS